MIENEANRRIRGLSALIGNTPLLAIEFLFRGEKRVLYAKAENLNLTGSIKDRMAFHILRQAYLRGELKPGAMIVEATSGNTGISFSGIGRALGRLQWFQHGRIQFYVLYVVLTLIALIAWKLG